MKWLGLIALWIVAVVAALLILRRMRRGKNLVLTGRWSPQVVRMIAVVLVVLGTGDEVRSQSPSGAPVKLPAGDSSEPLPAALHSNAVYLWLQQFGSGAQASARRELSRLLLVESPTPQQIATAREHAKQLHEPLRRMVLLDLQARAEAKLEPAATAAELVQTLDSLEEHGRFDHGWNAYLWRKAVRAVDAKDAAASIKLFARFRQHARITDALIRAQSQVKPVIQSPRAWMSKAGPRPEERAAIKAFNASLEDMVKVAREMYPATDEGTWKRDGIVPLKADKEGLAPALYRSGELKIFPSISRLVSADWTF